MVVSREGVAPQVKDEMKGEIMEVGRLFKKLSSCFREDWSSQMDDTS